MPLIVSYDCSISVATTMLINYGVKRKPKDQKKVLILVMEFVKSVNQNYLKIYKVQKMNKPKYEIGDRIPDSELVVRGIAPQKNGNYLYWIQIIESDNTFVGTEDDIEQTIEIVNNEANRLMSIARGIAIETLDY
jgi:hypothetical protein